MAESKDKIEVVGKGKIPGTTQFKVYAGTGTGDEWKAVGHALVDLPTDDTSDALFIAAHGGMAKVRKYTTSARMVEIRAEIKAKLNGNGKGKRKGNAVRPG